MPIAKCISLAPGQLLVFWSIEESVTELTELVKKYYSKLEGLDGINNETQRSSSLAVRLAAWHGFQALGIEPVLIPRREKGPPIVPGAFISMSHSPVLAAAFISTHGPVGIDVEKPRPQFLLIKSRFLNLYELEWAKEDLNQLANLWTAKEAIYKRMQKPGLSLKADISLRPGHHNKHLMANVNTEGRVLNFEVNLDELAGHKFAYVQ